jgi:hypothetical protein
MLHVINAILCLASGLIAINQFRRGNNAIGWFNLAASAINLVALAFWLLGK